MSDSDKPFTISDRRHFTPEGRVREGAEKDSAAGPSPNEPQAREAAEPSTDSPNGLHEKPRAPRDAPGTAGGDAGPVDLGQFLLSLGAQAGMLLSGQGLPEGTDPKESLTGARSIISILEMLQEKTKGNRTEKEDQLLEGLLFELRMAYVEQSRATGS